MKDLKGHTAIVTGACGGIGSAFASALAERGCALMLVDLNAEALEKMSREMEEKTEVYHLPLDLTSPGAAEKLFNHCDEKGIDPDILINNAGIFSFRPVVETEERRIDTFIDLHVRAVVELSRAFALRRIPKGSGRILNMSSMSCWMPMPGIALYSSTKAFIRVFTRALHYELKDYGITATAACPGGIATDLFGLPPHLMKLAVAIGAVTPADKFARNAIKRMMKGKKQYINGFINRISIPLVGIMPTPVRMLVKRKMLDKGIRR